MQLSIQEAISLASSATTLTPNDLDFWDPVGYVQKKASKYARKQPRNVIIKRVNNRKKRTAQENQYQ